MLLGILVVPVQVRAQLICDDPSTDPISEGWPEMPAQVIVADPRFGDHQWRLASADRLASSWGHLLDDLRSSKDLLSKDEQALVDRLLHELRNALLALTMFSAVGRQMYDYGNSLRELIPNATALRRFFEQKRAENPNIGAFKKLARHAHSFAKESDHLSPTVPAYQVSEPELRFVR